MNKDKASTNDELRSELEAGLLKLDLSDFANIGEDVLELSLDVLLEDDILKDAPLVGVAAKLYSAGSKIHMYHVQKNILHFFQEYSHGAINQSKREEFLARFQDDQKYRRDVLDIILISLTKYHDAIQARVLANLIVAHLNGLMDFQQLRACEFALNMLNPLAYQYLDVLAKSETPFVTNRPDRNQEALLFSAGIASRDGFQLRVSSIGQDLFVQGIKPLAS